MEETFNPNNGIELLNSHGKPVLINNYYKSRGPAPIFNRLTMEFLTQMFDLPYGVSSPEKSIASEIILGLHAPVNQLEYTDSGIVFPSSTSVIDIYHPDGNHITIKDQRVFLSTGEIQQYMERETFLKQKESWIEARLNDGAQV